LKKTVSFVNAPEFSCIDEQLLEFHGNVGFRQYIASKPGKFGMKIFWLTNSDGTYVYFGIPYIGSDTLSKEAIQSSSTYSEALVMELLKPFYESGTHVTADNYFTSSTLVDRLTQKGISYISTMNVNRSDVPPAAKSTSGRSKGDSKFYYSGNQLLCSFYDKKKTPVLLLDSYLKVGHHEPGTKPDTVLLYNEKKSGVDNMDKLVRIMSMKRKCRRWPYGFVMNLLNIAALNGMYVFKNTISLTSAQTKNLHFDFLVACGMQLIESEVQNRAKTCKKNSGIAVAIRSLGFLPDEVETTKPNEEDSQMVLQLSSAMRCSFCERKKDRKSRIACSKCYKPMCNDHRCQKCRQCH